MGTDRLEKETIWSMILLWGSGVLFLLCFSYMTSPLFPHSYGWDSSFFQLVGAGMTKGYLPYRDFYDMKGPWLFFIEYAAQLICYGRLGIFILQCINMGIILFLCRENFRKYFHGRGIVSSLLVSLPLYIVLSSTMEGGNLTEEWSLIFLLLPIYLSLDFIMENREEHKPLYGFFYGVCFGVLALIRITNSVMICAIVLTVTVHLIKNRKWRNFWGNVAAFLLGVAAAFVLPLLYFGYYGEIDSMLYCVFVFGFVYGTEGYAIGTGGIFLITLLFPVLIFLLTRQDNKRIWMLVICNTAGMMITLGMGNSTLHDYILIIPNVMFGIWRLAETWRDRKAAVKIMLAAAILICFAYPGYKMMKAGVSILRQAGDDTAYQYAMETADCIPEEERNSVWAYEVPMRWYAIADIMPYCKYCGWQEHYMELSPQIASEVREMLETDPPIWIVTGSGKEIENMIVKTKLQENYELFIENSDCSLYRLK